MGVLVVVRWPGERDDLVGLAQAPAGPWRDLAADGDQDQAPMLDGSIQSAEHRGSSPRPSRSSALAALATITDAEATEAAGWRQSLTRPVDAVQLGNENGSVVDEVTMISTRPALSSRSSSTPAAARRRRRR